MNFSTLPTRIDVLNAPSLRTGTISVTILFRVQDVTHHLILTLTPTLTLSLTASFILLAGRADAILYSIPELGSLEESGGELSRQQRGRSKLIYMCLEAAEEYECFIDLPPKPGDSGRGKHPELYDLFAGHNMCADIPAVNPLPSPGKMLAPAPSYFDPDKVLVSYILTILTLTLTVALVLTQP